VPSIDSPLPNPQTIKVGIRRVQFIFLIEPIRCSDSGAIVHANMGWLSLEILIWDYWPNGQWVVAVPLESSLNAVSVSN